MQTELQDGRVIFTEMKYTVDPAEPNAEPIQAESQSVSQESINSLRADILRHFEALDLPGLGSGNASLTKEAIRAIHAHQRRENYLHEQAAFGRKWPKLLAHFADGNEVEPSKIAPELEPVESDHESGYLFRLATLLWSVPVSHGYGRRMRYLVCDKQNGKLIGIFALGDPVFNLQARDKWIGWDVNDRRARLVHVMDAFVVGAVPPYSHLLGGKLVAALIGSAEVSRDFATRYSQSTGIISQQQKAPRLALVTVTSALGRSSLYNRLKLNEMTPSGRPGKTLVELQQIGKTQGYGHFQLSNELFERVREILSREGHPYADGHQYGQGPNWRMRVMRAGLQTLGLDQELVRHGIVREVYAMPMAEEWRGFLCGQVGDLRLERPTAATIAAAALEKWVLPRAERRSEYAAFRRENLLGQLVTRGREQPTARLESLKPRTVGRCNLACWS